MQYSWLPILLLFPFFRGSSGLFLRVETGHQNIAIDGRDAYFGHFTKIHFHNRTCLSAIDIHCLKELTGAEEIDLLYSECHKDNWKVAHYTNSKHHFRLKQPVHALRLLISSRHDLAIIDAQVESCATPNTTTLAPKCHHAAHNHRHSKSPNILRATDAHRRAKRSSTINEQASLGPGHHNITKDLVVPRGTLLTILEGTDLRFADGVALIVNGRLHVNGSDRKPVTMSRMLDSEKWSGVKFIEAEPGSIITHTNISGSDTGILVDRGNPPHLDNLIVEKNERGIVMNETDIASLSPIAKITAISNQGSGIEYTGKGSVSFDQCICAGNGKSGIVINNASAIYIRRSQIYSNSENGIHLKTIEAILEDVVVNSNKKCGIKSEISGKMDLVNVNISAHRTFPALDIEITKNTNIGISRLHIHDNHNGAIRVTGSSESSKIIIRNSNFTRNFGNTVSFDTSGNSTILFEKTGFVGNSFADFDMKKDAVLKIMDHNIAIRNCDFSKNTMHSILSIEDHTINGCRIDVTDNRFVNNLAHSVIVSNAKLARFTTNHFDDQRATCELTFTLPRIPADRDELENRFVRGNAICTGDLHPYRMDQPDHTTTTISHLEILESPLPSVISSKDEPYRVESEIVIGEGESIEIAAGTILDFAPSVGITIQKGGKLRINGEPDTPVVMRGLAGNWRGLVAKPQSELEMSNTVIEDASIGVWIDSDAVQINGGRIERPVVHGVEITHNSESTIDLGGLEIVGGGAESAIGIDERHTDLEISNFTIRDTLSGGVGFMTPSGNLVIRDAVLDNTADYGIHIAEFSSTPLHSVIVSNVSVTGQKRGNAGILISGGWVRDLAIERSRFANNSVASLIIAVECHDETERLVRIVDSVFTENSDIVQHVSADTCVSVQLFNNTFERNNLDGTGSTLVLSTPNNARISNSVLQIENNDFLENSGIYSVSLDSTAHHTVFADNRLNGNNNSAAVLKISGQNANMKGNIFSNAGSRFQLAYNENDPIDASNNDWNGLEGSRILESMDAKEGTIILNPNPVSVVQPGGIDFKKCEHLKFCSNRGECKDGFCTCDSNFTGLDCSIPISCNCSANGICNLLNECICAEGWNGAACVTPICHTNCSQHGRCISPNMCECDRGWRGDVCSQMTCRDEACIHGHCDSASGLCRCENGWRGSRCHVPICDHTCSLNGVCVSPNQCRCFADFGGHDCSQCVGDTCGACDFDCDHGRCESLTGTCSCVAGWVGGACDICVGNGTCQSESGRVHYIVPSTSEIEDGNTVVNVFGSEFSKTEGNKYICTFGRTTVTGHRVSSTVVRCPVPANLTLGRHAFTLSHPGSFSPLATTHSTHFTLFEGCDRATCQGACVGPLCICAPGKTGIWCDVIEAIPTIDQQFVEHQKANRAEEGTPYVVMLPTMTSSVLRINSTIPNLSFISSKGIIAWEDPIGSDSDYSISVIAHSAAGVSNISWNVHVEPTYTAEIDSIDVSESDGIARIRGRVISSLRREWPVIIRVRRAGVVDEIRAESDEDGNISYDYVPVAPGNYEVTIAHPNSDKTSESHTFMIRPLNLDVSGEPTLESLKLEINGKEKCDARLLKPRVEGFGTISGSNRLELEFGREWAGEVLAWVKCDGGSAEIVRAPEINTRNVWTEPEQLAVFEADRMYEVVLHFEKRHNPISISTTADSLQLVSTDPPLEDFNSQILRLYLSVNNPTGNNGSIEVRESEQLLTTVPYFFLGSVKSTAFKICIRDELDGQETGSDNGIATLTIRNSQKNVDISKTNIRLNVQWIELNLEPAMYTIEVRSEGHVDFEETIRLDPLNTTWCIQMSTSRSKETPSVMNDKILIRSISNGPPSVPYLRFEPSVVTENGQKILATVESKSNGLIGMWNERIDSIFDVIPSKRSVQVNQSFWINIEWSELGSFNCSARLIEIPFVFLPENSDVPIQATSRLLVQQNPGKTICNNRNQPIPSGLSTRVMCNCGDGARASCRQRYRAATACGSAWQKIHDDTVSLEVLISFLSMRFECLEVSVDFSEIRESLKCVASIEANCPIGSSRHRRDSDSPLRIVNHLSSVKMDLGRVLPILNALDMQSIRISSQFIDFIDCVENVFPNSMIANLDRDTIDSFLSAISDQSDEGIMISEPESRRFSNPNSSHLVNTWQKTVRLWTLGSEEMGGAISYADAQRLVSSADRIKSIARQNGAENPFSMLHGYMERILETGESEQRECAIATVFIKNVQIEEDGQFLIRVHVQNLANTTLSNIGVTLDFEKHDSSTPEVTFNVGPSWSAGIGSLNGLGYLEIGAAFEIHWTRFVSASKRLSRIAKYKPIIVLSFASYGRQTQQKLLVAEIAVSPKKTIKAINIIKDVLSPIDGLDFSIISSIINPGYSPLTNVKIVFENLKSEEKSTLESIYVNGKPTIRSLIQNFDGIGSGSTELVRIRMIDDFEKTVRLESVNITCVENGKLMEFESIETYAIRAVGPSDYGMMVSPVNQSAPLFFFRPAAAQMVNLIRLEFLSLQPVTNASKKTYIAAFRNPESVSFGGALWAQMAIPEVGINTKLEKIIDRTPPRSRELQATQWESEENGKEILNWVDVGGFVAQQVITYELQFDEPTEQFGPMFEESQYRIDVGEQEDEEGGVEIGQVSADGEDLTYSLYSPDNEKRFGIDRETGAIYIEPGVKLDSNEEYCVVVEVRDSMGRRSKAPVAINSGGIRKECSIFSTDGLIPSIHVRREEGETAMTTEPPTTIGGEMEDDLHTTSASIEIEKASTEYAEVEKTTEREFSPEELSTPIAVERTTEGFSTHEVTRILPTDATVLVTDTWETTEHVYTIQPDISPSTNAITSVQPETVVTTIGEMVYTIAPDDEPSTREVTTTEQQHVYTIGPDESPSSIPATTTMEFGVTTNTPNGIPTNLPFPHGSTWQPGQGDSTNTPNVIPTTISVHESSTWKPEQEVTTNTPNGIPTILPFPHGSTWQPGQGDSTNTPNVIPTTLSVHESSTWQLGQESTVTPIEENWQDTICKSYKLACDLVRIARPSATTPVPF